MQMQMQMLSLLLHIDRSELLDACLYKLRKTQRFMEPEQSCL